MSALTLDKMRSAIAALKRADEAERERLGDETYRAVRYGLACPLPRYPPTDILDATMT